MKINPTVTGITTISEPHSKLQRKFAKEGVMDINLFCYSLLNYVNKIEGTSPIKPSYLIDPLLIANC